MTKYIVQGGSPLFGEVHISGAKNAAVAILPAALLVDGVCRIENIPQISDVTVLLKILEQLGAKVRVLNRSDVELDCRHIVTTRAPQELAHKLRASYYLIGALLGRFGEAEVSMPGGCNFGGTRPIDQHVKGFAAMGATVREGDYICAAAEGGRMKGANIYLDVVSVGATMNIMMAAALADGTTVIPVSKVSFGFGAGGSDFASKHAQAGAPMAFGGGGGAGVTVSPVCFLIITKDGSASILGINAQADSTVDRLVEMIPGAINRVSSFVEGFSGKKKAPADESAPMEGGEE